MKYKALGTRKLPDDFVLLHALRADAVVPDQPENSQKWAKVNGSIWCAIKLDQQEIIW